MEDTEAQQTSNVVESTLAKSLDQLIADQKLMLALLQKKFDPLFDIPKIAEKIWNSTDDAWTGSEEASKAPRDRSLGAEFLATLEPCGTTITGRNGTVDQNSGEETNNWISEDNLVIARRTLDTWIQNGGYGCPRVWEELFSNNFRKSREIDQERMISQALERWPKTWDPLRFSIFREPQYNSYGNKMNLFYATPNVNKFSDPLKFTLCDDPSQMQELRETNSINGIICQVSLPRSPGIIDWETMATILCLGKVNKIFPQEQHDFLDAHVSEWHVRPRPLKVGRREFQSSRHMIAPPCEDPGLLTYGVLMHYMRSFTVVYSDESPIRNGTPFSGLRCRREKINFRAFYGEHTQTLIEQRYSTALSVFPAQYPGGSFALLSLIDVGEYEYREWDNSAATTQYGDRGNAWKNYGIYPAGLYTGISIFQIEICSMIDLWERDWNKTINQVEMMVSVRLNVLDHDERLKKLVLDTNPDDLVLYFKDLQMLGRFNDVILADAARLKSLSVDVWKLHSSDYWWQETYRHNEDTQRILECNWETVRKRQQQAADNLTTRIKQTKEEVRGLIDGLYNVQSVIEAQKSRKLNKYMMVFTIVTVIFLPPSFAATFFSMDAFQSSDTSSTQRTFWTVLGILSGLTYIIAGMGLFGANTSSAQIRLRLLKGYKSQFTGNEEFDPEASDEGKVSFGIKKIVPWFGKVRNIWAKSPKESSVPNSDTPEDNQDEKRDVPAV